MTTKTEQEAILLTTKLILNPTDIKELEQHLDYITNHAKTDIYNITLNGMVDIDTFLSIAKECCTTDGHYYPNFRWLQMVTICSGDDDCMDSPDIPKLELGVVRDYNGQLTDIYCSNTDEYYLELFVDKICNDTEFLLSLDDGSYTRLEGNPRQYFSMGIFDPEFKKHEIYTAKVNPCIAFCLYDVFNKKLSPLYE